MHFSYMSLKILKRPIGLNSEGFWGLGISLVIREVQREGMFPVLKMRLKSFERKIMRSV